jgi:pimeloyl-ACP methyl ester carboxylesterase
MPQPYSVLPNDIVPAANGIDYACRDTGGHDGITPLVLLQQAGKEALGRIHGRSDDRDEATDWATREAQYDAVCAWGIPDHAELERVSALRMPVFVANGDSDPMILPHYSYLLAGLIPQARLKIYPDAAHGFLFQHHAAFAADVVQFLS